MSFNTSRLFLVIASLYVLTAIILGLTGGSETVFYGNLILASVTSLHAMGYVE
jgi:hypothetical protein